MLRFPASPVGLSLVNPFSETIASDPWHRDCDWLQNRTSWCAADDA